MIHYHGTPCGSQKENAARFLNGRHALISFYYPDDIGIAAEVCQSFCIDNGAFSAWKQKDKIKWDEYFVFVEQWRRHPGFDFAIIPDVIDGDEESNDMFVTHWELTYGKNYGVPVWHMHESLERLNRLVAEWPRVCLGSSGEYATVGNDKWWSRMNEAMKVACDKNGAPKTKLHGLRMLDPGVFTKLPLASADSTNAVRNAASYSRFGMYKPPNASTRMHIIAERIEAHQSCALWSGVNEDQLLLF